MLNFSKSTKVKMLVAQLLYWALRCLGINSCQLVERQGIKYDLNLKEGIDLSIYLFGNFQKHVYKNILRTGQKIKTALEVAH